MPSLCRTSRFRRSPASFRSPSLIMSSTPFTEVGCMDLRVTFLLILCSCAQVIAGLPRRHQNKTISRWEGTPFLRRRPSTAVRHSSPWPLPQLARQNQSPTTQNHPLWTQHQGDMYKDSSLTWEFLWGWLNVLTLLKCNILGAWIRSARVKNHLWCQISQVLIIEPYVPVR